MSDDTEKTLIALAAALAALPVSGLAFLAYKHPEAYPKFAMTLLGVCFGLWVMVGIWDFSNAMAVDAVVSLGLDTNIADKVKSAIRSNSLSFVWCTGVFCVVVVYVMFLWWLPIWLDKTPPKSQA